MMSVSSWASKRNDWDELVRREHLHGALGSVAYASSGVQKAYFTSIFNENIPDHDMKV